MNANVSKPTFKITARESLAPPFPAGAVRWIYESAVDRMHDRAIVLPGINPVWFVVIHGHGSHEDQLYMRADIRDGWLPAMQSTGAGILTPNLRDNAWMSPAATRDLRLLLKTLRDVYGAERFIFFSGSMGGSSNFYFAIQHPDDVAAFAALGAAPDPAPYAVWCRAFPAGSIQRQIGDAIEGAYNGPPETNQAPYQARSTVELAHRLSMPVFFAHGEKDALMPVAEARRLAKALEKKPSFRYMEVPAGSHDAPLFLPEAIRWLKDQVAAVRA